MIHWPHLALFLTIPLILLFPGCTSHQPSGTGAIDLLGLLPPETMVACDDPPAANRSWGFPGAVPEGWAAGPEGVVLRRLPDGLELTAPEGTSPWVETDLTIDPQRYFALLAVVEGLENPPARLFYAFDTVSGYYPLHMVIGGYPPGSRRPVLRFRLPTPDTIAAPIRRIRITPDPDRRTMALKRVMLQARQPGFLSRHVLNRSSVELGQEYRHCWRLAGDGRREVTLRLPRGEPQLSLALGTLNGRKPGTLSVDLVRTEGQEATILRRPFPGKAKKGWQEVTADLSRWDGEEVTLRFTVQGGGPRSVRLIGTQQVRSRPQTRRPSVLLVMLDAQRADRLSLYGHDQRTSPHLARLAREGILYSRVTAPFSWTLPSVVAAFTGRHAEREGIVEKHGNGIPDADTLAEHFSRAGYATGGFSANHLLTRKKGFDRGFDTWYLAPFKGLPINGGQLNRRALRWLRAHRDEETFCYLHYMDPHDPYNAPWPEAPSPNSSGLHPAYCWQSGFIQPLINDGVQLTPEEVGRMGRRYDRGSRYTDFQLGRMLATLRREGLLEHTVVLVTGDHGDELHDHGYWGHGVTLFQEVLHVPMILRMPQPGPEAGTVVHTPVTLLDIAPTLTAVAGLDIAQEGIEGQDLRTVTGNRPLYSVATGYGPLRFAVTRPPWKYIHFDRKSLETIKPRSAKGRWGWRPTGNPRNCSSTSTRTRGSC